MLPAHHHSSRERLPSAPACNHSYAQSSPEAVYTGCPTKVAQTIFRSDRAGTTVTAAPHPLDPLTTEEYAAAVTALRARDEVHDRVRISAIGLREPTKQALAEAAEGGSRPPRQAEAVLHDPTRAAVWEAVVELDGDPRVIAFERVEGVQSG